MSSANPPQGLSDLLGGEPHALLFAEIRAVAIERAGRATRFTSADIATLLEAFQGEVIPDLVNDWAVSCLKAQGRWELGRPPTSLQHEAVLRLAHREYKALLTLLQNDEEHPDALFDAFRKKCWWSEPPSERAFQIIVLRYRYWLPDRADPTLRRLIRAKSTKKTA